MPHINPYYARNSCDIETSLSTVHITAPPHTHTQNFAHRNRPPDTPAVEYTDSATARRLLT